MIKGNDFAFESVDLLDYKLHRVRLNRAGSYIKSLKWLEIKKATTNPKIDDYDDDDDDDDDDDECLQWSIISTLNYNDIMKNEFENIFKKIKHEDKDSSLHKRDWENFERNNESVALNV